MRRRPASETPVAALIVSISLKTSSRLFGSRIRNGTPSRSSPGRFRSIPGTLREAKTKSGSRAATLIMSIFRSGPTFGRALTSRGKSDQSSTPTTRAPSPSANRISVLLQVSETIRCGTVRLMSNDRPPAIHNDDLPGDEIRPLHKEEDRLGHIGRIADPSEGGGPHDRLSLLLTVLLRKQHRAGRHCVHLNLRRKRLGEALGQRDQRAF